MVKDFADYPRYDVFEKTDGSKKYPDEHLRYFGSNGEIIPIL